MLSACKDNWTRSTFIPAPDPERFQLFLLQVCQRTHLIDLGSIRLTCKTGDMRIRTPVASVSAAI
jgi:hypothetical protein